MAADLRLNAMALRKIRPPPSQKRPVRCSLKKIMPSRVANTTSLVM